MSKTEYAQNASFLKELKTPALVTLWNQTVKDQALDLEGVKPVTRFADRAAAETRVAGLLERCSLLIVDVASGVPEVMGFEAAKKRFEGSAAMNDLKAPAMKGHVRAKDAPHPAIRSITSSSGPEVQAEAKKTRQAAAAKDAIKAKPETAPAARRSIWQRPKHENASKVAYKPEDGTVQAALYDILTKNGADGITMEAYCEAAKQVKTKDSTLFTPSAVWGALRYLFVTNRGYGLDFDGERLRLLVPADERQSSRKLKR